MTTTFAFILGCISTIPGIRWLCIYAGVTIVFDFLYQVTYFIALLTLDERRATKALHGDNAEKGQKQSWWQWCCCCFECCCGGGRQGKSISQSNPPQEQRPEQYMESQRNPLTNDEEKEFVIDRIMRWYSYQLLRPTVRVVVLVVFLGIFGLNVWSTSQLTQEFNVEDYVPDDSYVKPFLSALEEYSPLKVPMAVYFRYVNQSDPLIQKQMIDYIDEISALPQIGRPPEYCWVRDMYSLLNAGEDAAGQVQNSAMLSGATDSQKEQLALMSEALQNGDYTFEEKMQIVLSIPGVQDVYGEDIVQDPETLEITASRCHIFLRHLELNDIKEQIEMLHDQHKITSEQPINQGKDDFPFFSFDDLFYYWQLVSVSNLLL